MVQPKAPIIVVDNSSQQNGKTDPFFRAVELAVSGPSVVSFDCEGVNLGRFGSIELVSLYVTSPEPYIFLVDVGKASKDNAGLYDLRIAALKNLFESSNTEKVIHDCRMDSDVLYHNLGIRLTNVHDTSCYYHVQMGTEDTNLATLLSSYGQSANVVRDKGIYKRNPAFWATRPMNQTMITWAAADVDQLLNIASVQKAKSGVGTAKSKSESFCNEVRSMQIQTGLSLRVPVGRFVGRGGSNIRAVQKRSDTVIYSCKEVGKSETWVVYYKSRTDLQKVKSEMGY